MVSIVRRHAPKYSSLAKRSIPKLFGSSFGFKTTLGMLLIKTGVEQLQKTKAGTVKSRQQARVHREMEGWMVDDGDTAHLLGENLLALVGTLAIFLERETELFPISRVLHRIDKQRRGVKETSIAGRRWRSTAG